MSNPAITIGPSDPARLREQLAAALRRAIADGEAGPGDRLPPARDFAAVLGVFVPLIQQAWEHRRRRHRVVGAAGLACALVVGIVAGFAGNGSGSPSGSGKSVGPAVVPPSAVLSAAPYMGVDCPVANSIACDRVGLAVSLKRPAVSVTATVSGARMPMDHRGDVLYAGDSPRTEFDGFLQPVGIVSRFHVKPVDGNVVNTSHGHVDVVVHHRMWFGDVRDYPAPVSVRLTIQEPGGHTLVTHTSVELATGWG